MLERHLELCPRCRNELRAHRDVAGVLGYAGQEAPVGLWDRIVASTQEAPPTMRADHLHLIGSASGGRAANGAHRGRTLRARTVGVLALAAAVVVAVLGVQMVRLDDRTTQLNHAMAAISATPSMGDVRRALAQPGSRQIRLASLGGRQTEIDAVLVADGSGYVYNSKLTPLPGDRTYQLWGIVGGDRISYGLLGNDPSGVTPFRAGRNVQAMAVTSEKAGGVES
ncbi:MAG: anti-sigma factor domain-containing protein, partial [Acidimicrobiales bacterium]